MNHKDAIVITGYGIMSALGMNKEENKSNLFQGKNGIVPYNFNYVDQSVFTPCGVLPRELAPHPFFEKEGIIPDPASNMAIYTVEECIQHAKVDLGSYDPYRIAIVVGTSLGGMRSADIFHKQWIEEGIDQAESDLLKQYPLHSMADIIGKAFHIQGAKIIISTACSSGANALGMGYDLLNHGRYDIVLVGGIDPLSRFSYAGFHSLKAIDKEPCSPFCRSSGINLGEGAAFFLLQKDGDGKHQQAVAQVLGYGITGDAYHPTAPDQTGNGALRSMTIAKDEAKLNVGDISYINGHGTGTNANDTAEKKAWKSFVGEHTEIPLMSNKAAVGHCMGAAGAVEIAFSLLAIENQMIPPTVNFTLTEQLNAIGIDFIPNETRTANVNHVISNSYAFGGNNCSVLLSSHKKQEKEKELCHITNDRVDSDKKDPIVITGIGCLGSGGQNIEEFFKTLEEGICWYETIDKHKDYNCRWTGKMPEIEYKKYIKGSTLRRMDSITKMAMVSGKEALIHGDVKVTPNNSTRIGVIYGTGTGPLETIEQVSRSMISEGLSSIDPNTFPNTVLNATPGQFSIANMLKGPNSTISSGSVSSLNAFIYACELLYSDKADIIVVLSSDEWNHPLQVGNDKLGLLTKNGEKPFRKSSSGMVLSPGSTAFILEKKSNAIARASEVLGQVYGYSMTSENAPLSYFLENSEAWKKSYEQARTMAGNPTIDYYASTAYGIPILDKSELSLMKERLDDITRVCNIPRLIGATSGSLGSYGLLSCIYALTRNKVPNQGVLEDDILDDYKKLLERSNVVHKDINYCSVSAASFGGSYTTVVIGRPSSEGL